MDRNELRARLLATFLGELAEHVRTFNREALALEKDQGPGREEILKTLFRAAHSLKGAARSAGVVPIEAACHRLEELLARARDGEMPADAALVEVLLATADAVEDAAERLRAKQDPSAGLLGELIVRLETAPRPVAELPPAMARPAAAKLGAAPAAQVTRSAPPPTTRAEPESPPAKLEPAPPAPLAEPAVPLAKAEPPVSEAKPVSMRTSDNIVRLSSAKLDALVARSGELLVARRRTAARQQDLAHLRELMSDSLAEWSRLAGPLSQLSRAAAAQPPGAAPRSLLPRRAALAFERTTENLKKLDRGLERLARGLAADQYQLDQAAGPLEDEIRRVRMLPFSEVCEMLERAVRDVARTSGKDAELVAAGSDVELDRAVLNALRDPLLHLVRNAVDHGVEPPDERVAAGKPRWARITVAASLCDGGVEIVVADDGRGLDVARIHEIAAKKKIAAQDGERESARLIFLPGFSTARFITELSGRGVGLDVVKHRVEALHGSVDVAFEPGRGTRFTLTVPLTLTTFRALMVAAAGQLFALPVANVKRLVRAAASDLGSVEGRDVLLLGGAPIPVASLADTLELAREGAQRHAKVCFVVVGSGEREAAFAVDELVAEQEIVVKNLGRRLLRVRHFAGATLLPTGRLALILAAPDLIATALARRSGRAIVAAASEAAAPRRRLLIADDSVTTRSLVKSILEAAGYEVVAAPDGAEAWQLLQDRGADLVVSDVEMPRMDGFALTEAIRASRRFRELPVILVTALDSEQDKRRGLEAGADAYLPKSAFDQTQLLGVIQQLL